MRLDNGAIIKLTCNTQWISTEIEKINEQTGEIYKRYQTIIEADATKNYGFKIGHSVQQEIDDTTSSFDRCEWLLFETNKPLISEYASFVLPNERDYFSTKEEFVEFGPILKMGTQCQEHNFPWKYTVFPCATFLKYVYEPEWVDE